MTRARQRVAAARQRVDTAQHDMLATSQSWREEAKAHRTLALVGAGFGLGFGLAALPLCWWSRAGGLVFRAAARLARTTWLPSVFAAFARRSER